MKKKKFKNLNLNKQSISNFKSQKLTGGSLEACISLIPDNGDCDNGATILDNECPSNADCTHIVDCIWKRSLVFNGG
ncbi:hypothetical protein GTQ40_03580 [Flavobacteriaceae bacterium R38]|nr:hypothetical protein [Flavobacteriaceae bacterium R38]